MSGSERYLIVLKDNVSPDEMEAVANDVTQSGGQVGQKLESSIMKGFVATLDPEQLQSLRSLRENAIEYIEKDSEVTIQK